MAECVSTTSMGHLRNLSIFLSRSDILHRVDKTHPLPITVALANQI